MKKLIVVLGQTASGKSELAVRLAKKFSGEVVSADSRQIYKGLNIGTGKISKEKMRGVPHYLLSIASPKKIFTVTQYRKLALKAINKIFKKNKIPILCGGTAFYIKAIIDGIVIPGVKPDWRLRINLNRLNVEELFKKLEKLDPRRAETIDKDNPRRLIRALEIVMKTKKPVPDLKKNPLLYPILILGIKISKKELEKKIGRRVEKMFRLGLEKEAKIFHLPIIGYQEWKDYFDGEINKERVKNLIKIHTRQFAKRQMTWWKKDKRISWVKNYREAEKSTKQFLQKIAD